MRVSDISKNIESYLNQTGLKYDSYIIRSVEPLDEKVVGGSLVYNIFAVNLDVLAKDTKGLIEFAGQMELFIDTYGELIGFQLNPSKRTKLSEGERPEMSDRDFLLP